MSTSGTRPCLRNASKIRSCRTLTYAAISSSVGSGRVGDCNARSSPACLDGMCPFWRLQLRWKRWPGVQFVEADSNHVRGRANVASFVSKVCSTHLASAAVRAFLAHRLRCAQFAASSVEPSSLISASNLSRVPSDPSPNRSLWKDPCSPRLADPCPPL